MSESSREHGYSDAQSKSVPASQSDSSAPMAASTQDVAGGFRSSAGGAVLPDKAITGQQAIQIEDLYLIDRKAPPSPKVSSAITDEVRQEIKDMYTDEYARGLDAFLESTWYTYKGISFLIKDSHLSEMFAGMLELFASTKTGDYENFAKLPQIEARMVWLLMCMPLSVSRSLGPENVDDNGNPRDPELEEVLCRLSIFEALITNRSLPANPLAAKGPEVLYPRDPRDRQDRFWHVLGNFVTLPTSMHGQSRACLDQLRLLLDMIENRDVLYSIAIVRHFGLSIPTFPEKFARVGSGSVDRDKLIVAKKFLEDEAYSKGTNQVIQRLCGMAVRSWAAAR